MIKITDLVHLTKVSEQMKLGMAELLFDALEHKYELFALSSKEIALDLVPCKKEWVEEEKSYIDMYDKNNLTHIEVELGQVLPLNQQAIKGLIVNKQFSEVELLRNLGKSIDDDSLVYWRTADELFRTDKWADGEVNYSFVNLDNVYMLKGKINRPTKHLDNTAHINYGASNTSLKVVGLLMHHLAKSPKFASGASPNKSQIKELLLELSVELGINNYGLSKVDERLLVNAMKYLDTQKE